MYYSIEEKCNQHRNRCGPEATLLFDFIQPIFDEAVQGVRTDPMYLQVSSNHMRDDIAKGVSIDFVLI